jgi:hypothetical protein
VGSGEWGVGCPDEFGGEVRGVVEVDRLADAQEAIGFIQDSVELQFFLKSEVGLPGEALTFAPAIGCFRGEVQGFHVC